MDPITILAILAALALGALVTYLATRGRGPGAADSGEIVGRLAQMAESQAATQAQLSERLQAQERSVTKAVEERLTEFSKRLGDRLQLSATQSQTTLTDLRERLAVIDKAQKNITELSAQVVGLQDILANKQARGAFGEIQLRDIVESILPPSAYDFQVTLGNGKRVDCLLELPNPPGPIAIDSKFPLESYQALREAREEPAIAAARRALAADVRKHVRDIAEKYIIPGETAESALLFLPSEAVYAELHANFRGVVEESFRARVWIVSPTTLMAPLNTVRAVLKDVARLDDRVGKLQNHFGQASEDLRQIRISTEKVTKRGEKIAQVELEEQEELEGLERLEELEAAPKSAAVAPQLKVISDD